MYKLSYYSIISSPVDERNTRVIYSTRSGEILSVSEYCFEALVNNLIEEIPTTVLDTLLRASILVPSNEVEIETVIAENRKSTETKTNLLHEIIQPTAMCQLGCYYCGQKHSKDFLSDDLIQKLISRIYAKFLQGEYTKIYIGWFGAEPLMGLQQMRKIYDGLKALVNNDAVSIGGKIVTNGVGLKPSVFEELITKFNIDQIEITLDGIQPFHDQHRYTKSGGASFDSIYTNLQRLLHSTVFDDKKCKIIIRCNVDEKNYAGVEPLIYKLAEDKLHTKIDQLYFIGIYSWAGNDAQKKSLTKEKFSMMKLKWDILKITLGYKRKPKLYSRKKQTCVATGGSTEVYDAFGNIFNCTEISYSDFYAGSAYTLGNLADGYKDTFSNKPHHDWYDVVKDTNAFPCHTCKLLPVCGGSCPKSWVEGNPACPPFKFSILKELELEYILSRNNPNDLSQALATFTNTLKEAQFSRFE